MADVELTVKQAAESLAKSPRTVRRWLESGKLSGRRVDRGNLGATWRVSGESVRRVAADVLHGQVSTDTAHGHSTDTLTADLVAEVRSLREENAEYRGHLERLTLEIGELRETIQKALPAATLTETEPGAQTAGEEKVQRPWWRLWS